jgi:hypothetical protein
MRNPAKAAWFGRVEGAAGDFSASCGEKFIAGAILTFLARGQQSRAK